MSTVWAIAAPYSLALESVDVRAIKFYFSIREILFTSCQSIEIKLTPTI